MSQLRVVDPGHLPQIRRSQYVPVAKHAAMLRSRMSVRAAVKASAFVHQGPCQLSGRLTEVVHHQTPDPCGP